MLGHVRQILTFSGVDGPGNRAVIFMQGCNMRCLTCHNPETIARHADQAQMMSVDEVLNRILPYRAFLSGVTLTGGECTIQAEFAIALAQALAKYDLGLLIDTNGLDFEALVKIQPYVEGFMLDIKSIDAQEHLQLTGMPIESVLASFEFLLAHNALVEVRTVVHHHLKSEETVAAVANMMAAHQCGALYKVIAFRPHGVKGSWAQEASPSASYMHKIESILKNYSAVRYIAIGV